MTPERLTLGRGHAGPWALLLAATGLLFALPALARPGQATGSAYAPVARAVPDSDPVAVALLRRSAVVERSTSWQATRRIEVRTPSRRSVVAQVAHLAGEGSWVSVVGTAQRTWEADDAASGWVELLARTHGLRLVGSQRLGAVMTTAVDALRPDGTSAARFFLDPASGMTLRRDLCGARGQVVRTTQVTDLRPVTAADASEGSLPAAPAARVSLAQGTASAGQLRLNGWVVPMTLPGATPTAYTLVDAQATGDTAQLTYTDGLGTLMLDERRGRLPALPSGLARSRRGRVDVFAAAGPPARLAWDARGIVYALTADADAADVDRVVAALPHRTSLGSYGHRLRRGIDRVGSWLDPFH
jgi:sigma-E factor negative regulatory protein RseB